MFDISWPAAIIVAVVIAAIAGIGGTFAYARSQRRHGDTPATNAEVLRRLESIDERLASVEKTLNDIP